MAPRRGTQARGNPVDTRALSGFIERHGLWSPEQREVAQAIARALADGEIDVVRFGFADLHGIVRGKSLMAEAAASALGSGVSITSTLLLKDTAHRTVAPVFTAGAGIGAPELEGGADVVMVPDPLTFRRLPWLAATGWVLCDLFYQDGRPVPFSTRQVCRNALARLAERGFGYVSGLEVEFHVTRLVDPALGLEAPGQPGLPPEVAHTHQGYAYLTEQRLDQIEPILDILRRDMMALGLPLHSIEIEFGPSQCEFVFRPGTGMAPADDMILLRTAAKQICRRHGYHASFMCRPQFPNAMSSGWHLHQSLVDADGGNVFAGAAGGLSTIGRHFLAGLLDGARAATVFTTPTINGYKRYRANSLAPDRVAWARDNRGALLRVIDGMGPAATRIENRIGEPAANPYLYLASQIVTGMAGLDRGEAPPASTDTPYLSDAPALPTSLESALAILAGDETLRHGFGDGFIDYILMIKHAEVARYNSTVTDWEHREYFDLF